MDTFWNTWTELLTNIKPADTQSDETLRDCLYRTIKDSHALKHGLDTYRMTKETDKNKSRAYLENLILKTIEMNRSEKNQSDKDRYLKSVTNTGRPAITW